MVTLSGYQFRIGGLALMVIGAASGGTLAGATGPSAYVLLLYMGFLSAVAYTLWGVLLKYNPVSRVTIFGFMNPMFGRKRTGPYLEYPGSSDTGESWNLCGKRREKPAET